MKSIIESAIAVVEWWEENQYMTTGGEDEDNVFDCDADEVFEDLKKAVELKKNE